MKERQVGCSTQTKRSLNRQNAYRLGVFSSKGIKEDKSRRKGNSREKSRQTRGRSGDAVEDIRLNEKGRGGLGDIGTAGLPVGSLGVVLLLNNMPFVLDLDIPCWVGQGADRCRDCIVGAEGRVGSQALAVGIKTRRVLGCGCGDIETVGTTAGGAFELEVGRLPGGGLAVGESTRKAQGGEDDGEESGELHDGDGGYYPGKRDYRHWERVDGIIQVEVESRQRKGVI